MLGAAGRHQHARPARRQPPRPRPRLRSHRALAAALRADLRGRGVRVHLERHPPKALVGHRAADRGRGALLRQGSADPGGDGDPAFLPACTGGAAPRALAAPARRLDLDRGAAPPPGGLPPSPLPPEAGGLRLAVTSPNPAPYQSKKTPPTPPRPPGT